MKVAITHPSNELQVCNFTMLYLTKKLLNNKFIQIFVNEIVFKLTNLLNSDNLKKAIAQL